MWSSSLYSCCPKTTLPGGGQARRPVLVHAFALNSPQAPHCTEEKIQALHSNQRGPECSGLCPPLSCALCEAVQVHSCQEQGSPQLCLLSRKLFFQVFSGLNSLSFRSQLKCTSQRDLPSAQHKADPPSFLSYRWHPGSFTLSTHHRPLSLHSFAICLSHETRSRVRPGALSCSFSLGPQGPKPCLAQLKQCVFVE